MIRLACASLSFDGFGNNDFQKTFANVNEAGYRHLEFNCWYPETLIPAKMADIKGRCADKGVMPASLHVGGFGGEGREAVTRDLCHKMRAVDAAVELGCCMVSASGAGRGTAGGLHEIIDLLKLLMPYAEQHGVKVSLENHVGNNLEKIDDYERIFDAVDSANLGVCMDTGHFDAAAVSLDSLVDRLSSKINHIHLKENKGVGTKQFVRFGEGTTENTRIVERMIATGYSGYLVVELSPEIGESDKREFGIDDLKKPYAMFHSYERE
ncbi:MAG: sugar phosphate isomerase/epimerase [Spirochaetales bacterium]|nr:MAG: sugar phosphate isomerase/epimerase [Spirochaetales bacterium]